MSLHVLQIVREKKPMLDKRQQLFQFAKTLQLKKGNALQRGLQYMAPLLSIEDHPAFNQVRK